MQPCLAPTPRQGRYWREHDGDKPDEVDAEAKLRDELVSAFPLSCVENSLREMRPYTTKEMLKIAAGAVTSLIIVGWAAVLALALMSAR
jgi:hypothetical protein